MTSSGTKTVSGPSRPTVRQRGAECGGDLAHRLPDGGERRDGVLGDIEVVIADHRRRTCPGLREVGNATPTAGDVVFDGESGTHFVVHVDRGEIRDRDSRVDQSGQMPTLIRHQR